MTLAIAPLVAGCASPRENAHDQFVDQLVDDGGLDRKVAECVVDRFFDGKSNDELKAFFERKELTTAERAEFARLGQECAPTTT